MIIPLTPAEAADLPPAQQEHLISPLPHPAPLHPCSGAEIIPSALVLYILRKLPPKRTQQGYQQIPQQ